MKVFIGHHNSSSCYTMLSDLLSFQAHINNQTHIKKIWDLALKEKHKT